MTDLSAFPIATRWKAKHPDRIQLYSFPTPNGVKVSIALEELGVPYEPHPVNITKNESWTPEFLSLNPNGKIPAIIDPDGPGGKPIGLFESGAILLYLAEKTGKLIPADPVAALRDDPVGVLPDGRDWPDIRPGRVLPQIRRQGDRRQAAAQPLCRRIEASDRRHGNAAEGPPMVHGRRVHHRRHRPCRLGAQPDRILRGGRSRRHQGFSQCSGLARPHPCPPGDADRA